MLDGIGTKLEYPFHLDQSGEFDAGATNDIDGGLIVRIGADLTETLDALDAVHAEITGEPSQPTVDAAPGDA